MRNLTASIILAIGLTGSAFADTTPAKQTEQPATDHFFNRFYTGNGDYNDCTNSRKYGNANGDAAKTATSETPVAKRIHRRVQEMLQTALEPENATQGATPEIVTGGGLLKDLSVMGMYRINTESRGKKCHDRFATRLYCHLGAVLC